MRVIAGTCRGRSLRAPAGGSTRPTGDKVREAIFDILASQMDLDGTHVLDLFAGSGAMGIEALSRGADQAVFVDSDNRALDAVRANLDALGLAERAVVVRAEVTGWLARGQRADLAFCDPPYDFDGWETVLDRLDTTVAVLETSQPVEIPPRWETTRQKRYGGTLVTVVRGVPGTTAFHSAAPDPDSANREETS